MSCDKWQPHEFESKYNVCGENRNVKTDIFSNFIAFPRNTVRYLLHTSSNITWRQISVHYSSLRHILCILLFTHIQKTIKLFRYYILIALHSNQHCFKCLQPCLINLLNLSRIPKTKCKLSELPSQKINKLSTIISI